MTASDPRWVADVEAARGIVLGRLKQLLGNDEMRRCGLWTSRPAGGRREPATPRRDERPTQRHVWRTSHGHADPENRSSSPRFAPRPASSSARSKDFTAPELGAHGRARGGGARRHRARHCVDECIMGNVIQAGVGQNPARQAALNGGLDEHVAALTINKVCGSGLKAVMLAAQGIATGDIDVAVAGGMESMSNAPYLLPRVREGLRMGNGTVVDSMIARRPVVRVRQLPHGHVGRVRRRDVSRRRARSRTATPSRATARPRTRRARAGSRTRSCRSACRRRRAPPVIVDRDEPIREDTLGEIARRAEAGVQEGRQRHRRQRARRERRRGRARGHGRRRGAGAAA